MRLLALCLALTACAEQRPPADARRAPPKPVPKAAPPAPAPPPAPVDGHQRMIHLLAQVARHTPDLDPVLGTRKLRDLRAQLKALPAKAELDKRVMLLGRLAEAEMEQGLIQEAIGHLEAAMQALATRMPHERVLLEAKVRFWLAIAWMREGENRNCIEHHNPERCILPISKKGQYTVRGPTKKAIEHLEWVTHNAGPSDWSHFAGRWLLNIAHMTLGTWPQKVPEQLRVAFPNEAPEFPRFKDVAGKLGVDSLDLCGGAIADDFDGDGRLDLISSTWDPAGPLRFWRSEGQGFTEASKAANLEGITGGLNLVHGDYDNDGDLDLLVLRGAWLGEAGRIPNSLLRNDGKGRFTDVTFEAGLGEDHRPSQAAAFADYDLDGDLDLFIGNEGPPATDLSAQLFRNDGKGHFTDVAAEAGVLNGAWAKGVAWGDYDNDGDPDLFVSNLHAPNRLYRNDAGRFTEVTAQTGVAHPIHSFAPWFWDFDEDGHLDLLVNSYQLPANSGPPHVWYVAASHLGRPHPADLPKLYKGDGKGGFNEVATDWGLDKVTLPMGAAFGDLDNDGWLDFYLGTGYPGLEGLMPNRMYRNTGKRFVDVTVPGGFGHVQKGHGIAFADLDNDGDQDIWEQVGGFLRADPFLNALFENPGTKNGFIALDLRGVRSNRFAVGAKVRVKAPDFTRHRVVGFGSSFGGNPHRVHVGVGAAKRVEVEVVWPHPQVPPARFELEANAFYRLTEGGAPERAQPPRIRW